MRTAAKPDPRVVPVSSLWSSPEAAADRRVECNLDKRHELVERLFFWGPAGKTVGQVKGTVFECQSPMQDIAIDRRHKAKSAGCRIDVGCCGPPTDREFGCNSARDAKRPEPRHAVREVAQTLAEENPRLERARSPRRRPVGCPGGRCPRRDSPRQAPHEGRPQRPAP